MSLHNKRLTAFIAATALTLTVLLSSCGYERIGPAAGQGETGEFYTADRSDSPGSEILRSGTSGQLTAVQKEFADFCLTVFKEEMSDADTLDLHYTLLAPEQFGIDPGEATLGTYSLEEMIKDNEEVKDLKSRLSKFDRTALTANQQITYDALSEALDTSLMAEGLELYEQPLAPTIGIQAQLPILLAEYSFHSLKDVEDYIALLTQIDRYYNEILKFENQKADAGLAPSDASIDAIIQSCESYLIDPDSNFLTETFEIRLANLESETSTPLTSEQIADLVIRHNAAIREHFIPAYESLITGMSALKGRGLNDGGLSGLKDGKKYYEYLLKCGPGLSYSIPELKAALNSRMKQDYEAMEQLFQKYPDLEERVTNSSFSLTDPTLILEDLRAKMSEDFPQMAECGYEVRYVPKYLEQSLSPAFYLTAPLDNTNQNVIYINNGYSDSTDSLYTTLAHEGFPGHLYQTVYNRTHAETPLLSILSCSGANEGWATYAENYACTMDNGLADGAGEYRALIRSFSLCVHSMLDIGINYDGWSKEKAAEYVTSCFQVDDDIVNELWQTMIDNPTNYLEYCGGYIEIMEMREEAEQTLGNSFSPLKYHTFLLDTGPVPFSVIRNSFQNWLASDSVK